MWNLPGPGIKPVSPALAGGFLTTGSPEKSLNFTLTTRLCPPVNSLRRLVFICDCAPVGHSIPQRLQVTSWTESLVDLDLRHLHLQLCSESPQILCPHRGGYQGAPSQTCHSDSTYHPLSPGFLQQLPSWSPCCHTWPPAVDSLLTVRANFWKQYHGEHHFLFGLLLYPKCHSPRLIYSRDQALSLWSGTTDSKTLDYQRTKPRECQIVRTHTEETTWIQDPASPNHQ